MKFQGKSGSVFANEMTKKENNSGNLVKELVSRMFYENAPIIQRTKRILIIG